MRMFWQVSNVIIPMVVFVVLAGSVFSTFISTPKFFVGDFIIDYILRHIVILTIVIIVIIIIVHFSFVNPVIFIV